MSSPAPLVGARTRRSPRSGRPPSNGTEDLVRVYLDDIGRYQVLTRQQEQILAQAIDRGRNATAELAATGGMSPDRQAELAEAVAAGDAARAAFIRANLRLVVSLAKAYQASGLSLLDLIQEGNLGLLHAVEKFDWQRGCKFSTYATWWIRQAIQRGVARTARSVRLPDHAADLVRLLRRVGAELEDRYGRPATIDELAAATDLSRHQVLAVHAHLGAPASLDAPLGDGDLERFDVVSDLRAMRPDEIVEQSAAVAVQGWLRCLANEERQVVRLRFGFDGPPLSRPQAAQQLAMTIDSVRAVERRALRRLQRVYGAQAADLLLEAG